MATYEYLCLACEHPFEERRPMTGDRVATALACPSCTSHRVRRRFSFSTTIASAGHRSTSQPAGGGCGCDGCNCGK